MRETCYATFALSRDCCALIRLHKFRHTRMRTRTAGLRRAYYTCTYGRLFTRGDGPSCEREAGERPSNAVIGDSTSSVREPSCWTQRLRKGVTKRCLALGIWLTRAYPFRSQIVVNLQRTGNACKTREFFVLWPSDGPRTLARRHLHVVALIYAFVLKSH